MMTIALPPETEKRLKGEASRRGLDTAECAKKLIEEALARPVVDQATIDLIEQWEQTDATNDPVEIGRRRKECQEFMDNMNRNRLEMEGPLSRKVYP
jgi:hypothetical protein